VRSHRGKEERWRGWRQEKEEDEARNFPATAVVGSTRRKALMMDYNGFAL
jgi:hypothetical protein